MGKARQYGLRSLVDQPAASRLIACASDLALILDGEGKIVEVSLGDAIESHPAWKKLSGRRWVDTVSVESRGKVEQLLGEARGGQTSRPREINQKADGIGEIPLRFSGVLLDQDKHVVALGRDLRPLANMQQRMVSTQAAMDREYGRLRDLDTRYLGNRRRHPSGA
jgi:hypothetical protein